MLTATGERRPVPVVVLAALILVACVAFTQAAAAEQLICFVSERSGNRDIWIMEADGSNPSQLTTNTGLDEQPVPSPDGQRIAYVSDSGNPAAGPSELPNTDVWVMNVDGTGGTRLTSFTTNRCTQPAWSPGGEDIVFFSEDGGDWLYRVPADGSGAPTILESGLARYNPEYSPDGSSLIYDRDTGGGWWDLYRRTMPDGPETALATGLHSVAGAYSHSGDRIAYVQVLLAVSAVRMMNADGTNDHLVIDNSSVAYDGWGQLAWSPDDTLLAASIYNSLYPSVPEFDNFIQILDPDTGAEIYRTTSGRNMFAYECSLYSARQFVAANNVWSPDGSQLVFVSNRDGNWEVYVMDADGTDQTNLSLNSAWDGEPVWVDAPSQAGFDNLFMWVGIALSVITVQGIATTTGRRNARTRG